MPEAVGKSRSGEYVLAHINALWHVMFSPDDLPHHYVSVARFQDYSRAKKYADIEQWSNEDGFSAADADVMAVPLISSEDIAPRKPSTPPPIEPPPRTDLTRPLTPLEAEMESDLAELVKDRPLGVTGKDFEDWYGEPPLRVSEAMRALHDRGLATIVRRSGETKDRLVPIGYEQPPIARDKAQDKLLAAMCRMEVNGLVKASHRMLSDKSGVPLGSVPVALAMLIGGSLVARSADGAPQVAAAYSITDLGRDALAAASREQTGEG